MSIGRSFPAMCLCFLFIIGMSASALAQEINNVEEHEDVVSLAERVERPRWDASLVTDWLPASGIQGTGGDISMEEVKVGLGRRFTITPRLELSTGLRYSQQNIDAPQSALLPGTLQTVSLSLGGEYRTSEQLTLGLRVSPGLSSDFKSVTTSDVRVPVAFTAQYHVSKELTYLGGIAYTSGSHAFPVLPILGVLYEPSQRWTFAFGFPRTGVIFKPRKGLEFHLGAEREGGEYRLHDPSIGAEVISYRDFRGVAGVDVSLFSFLKLGVSGGYSFARRFVFYDGNRDDVRLDSAPLAKLEIKCAW